MVDWNNRNNPPLAEKELYCCLESAAENASGVVGSKLAEPEADISAYLERINVRDDSKGRLRGFDELDDTEPAPLRTVIEGMLGRSDKLLICGKSKARKSWFALQLALCISEGLPFLNFETTKMPVLYCNLELQDDWQHRRYKKIVKSSKKSFRNGHILDLRGRTFDERHIASIALDHEHGMIFLDPIYKLNDGDENSSEKTKEICRIFDYLARNTDAAIAYIHHDIKGNVAERDLVDRGAGSNILGRDYDASFLLAPHKDYSKEEPLIVVDNVIRNFPEREAVTAEWQNGQFLLREDLLPEKTMKSSPVKEKKPEPELKDFINECIKPFDPTTIRQIQSRASRKYELSDKKARALIDTALDFDFIIRSVNTKNKICFKRLEGPDGAQYVYGLFANFPDKSTAEIAKEVGVSDSRIRQLRRSYEAEKGSF